MNCIVGPISIVGICSMQPIINGLLDQLMNEFKQFDYSNAATQHIIL